MDEGVKFCAHCGAAVPPGAALCPSCGKPPAGAPPVQVKGPKKLIVVLIVAAVLLVGVAFLGIVAALFIPNFLDALQKAKQKRTVADLRHLGTGLESYAADHDGSYPAVADYSGLAGALVPEYLPELPAADGWKHGYAYACWNAAGAGAGAGCADYRLASPGRDGAFESEDLRTYQSGSFAVTDYDRDIVFGRGQFMQWPAQPGGS
jgi:type II secretory pathway pseudopilin PulG